jgi:NADH-quinone oxidoreductase subunit G
MSSVSVNDIPVDITGKNLNAIQAAELAGVLVPHYCWHPSLTVVASCRMCLVEVGEKKPDGTVAMQPKVVPGCQTPVKDGMVIRTNSEKAKQAQAETLEGLLINHPLDCPVCDKAGECKLQDYSFQFGKAQSRMIEDKNTPPNKEHIGPTIKLFTDRCIMCSRCVRFTREIAGTAELQIVSRGNHAEIDIFPGDPLDNKLAGNVVDLCPVGALGDKNTLYTQRVWYLQPKENICTGCSTGCSTYVDANKDIAYRTRPRPNELAQGYFLCDDGRYGKHLPAPGTRVTAPQARKGDALVTASWAELLPSLRRDLANVADQGPIPLAVVLSPFLSVEEAFLLAKYAKNLSSKAKLYLGHVPVVGQDDVYPKDRKGNPTSGPAKFTIRAEKAPNRLGVTAVIRHFEGSVPSLADYTSAAQAGQVKAVYLTGGYADEASLAALAALPKPGLTIVHDFAPLTWAAGAHYFLPLSLATEKEATYVNHAGLAQTVKRAMNAPTGVRSECQLFSDLLNLKGLVQVSKIRHEVAQTIAYFAPLGTPTPGEKGVALVS